MRSDEESRVDEFSGQDRRRLAKAMSSASELHLFQRAQAVLWVAEGDTMAEAAALAGVDRSSVYRWTQRYLATRNSEDLADEPRSGRPRLAPVLTEKLLAQILAQDPRQEGYRATTWTAPLLATHLRQHYQCFLSEDTLRRRLHEYEYRWKRPRYVFQERDPHVAQKKGRLCAA
jgi:transposase